MKKIIELIKAFFQIKKLFKKGLNSKNMDWIQTVLAGLIDKFKLKNPKVFAFVAVIVISVNMSLGNAADWDILPEDLPQWADYGIKILGQIVSVLIGSRTVKYLPGPAQMKVKDSMDRYD